MCTFFPPHNELDGSENSDIHSMHGQQNNCERFHFANTPISCPTFRIRKYTRWANELPFIFIKNGFVWDKVITVINWINNVASINFECVCAFGYCVGDSVGGSRYDMFMFIFRCACARGCGWNRKTKHMHLSLFCSVLLNVYLFTTNLDFVDTKSLSQFQVYTLSVYRV